MHACGHDGHTVIGIALAARLKDGDFAGTVRILFQPAQEGVRGAAPLLSAGVTQAIERMLAMHLAVDLSLGAAAGGAENSVRGAPTMYGVDVDTLIYGGTTTSFPDPEILDVIEKAAFSRPDITSFSRTSDLGLGSDNAHLLIHDVQKNGGIGSYILVVAQNSQASHHHYRFDFDESAMVVSIGLLDEVFRSQS